MIRFFPSASYVVMWDELLAKSPGEVAAALAEDSPRGRLLRETQPVFGNGLTSREVAAVIADADAPAAPGYPD